MGEVTLETISQTLPAFLFILPDKINLFGVDITVLSILITSIILVVGFVFARVVTIIISRYIGTRLPADARKNLSRFTYYGIIAITIVSALGNSGVNLSGLLVAGGIAGIVIGFATQSLFSNLISGIFLHLDRPMRIGDPVMITGKLPEITGMVVEVTPLSSRFRLFDGTNIRLPNTEVFSSQIRNFAGASVRRLELTVGIAFNEDASKAINLINEAINDNSLILVEPAPSVYINSFEDSGVKVNVWCWVPINLLFDIRVYLAEKIKQLFDHNNIAMSLPERVIHFADTEFNNSQGIKLNIEKRL